MTEKADFPFTLSLSGGLSQWGKSLSFRQTDLGNVQKIGKESGPTKIKKIDDIAQQAVTAESLPKSKNSVRAQKLSFTTSSQSNLGVESGDEISTSENEQVYRIRGELTKYRDLLVQQSKLLGGDDLASEMARLLDVEIERNIDEFRREKSNSPDVAEQMIQEKTDRLRGASNWLAGILPGLEEHSREKWLQQLCRNRFKNQQGCLDLNQFFSNCADTEATMMRLFKIAQTIVQSQNLSEEDKLIYQRLVEDIAFEALSEESFLALGQWALKASQHEKPEIKKSGIELQKLVCNWLQISQTDFSDHIVLQDVLNIWLRYALSPTLTKEEQVKLYELYQSLKIDKSTSNQNQVFIKLGQLLEAHLHKQRKPLHEQEFCTALQSMQQDLARILKVSVPNIDRRVELKKNQKGAVEMLECAGASKHEAEARAIILTICSEQEKKLKEIERAWSGELVSEWFAKCAKENSAKIAHEYGLLILQGKEEEANELLRNCGKYFEDFGARLTKCLLENPTDQEKDELLDILNSRETTLEIVDEFLQQILEKRAPFSAAQSAFYYPNVQVEYLVKNQNVRVVVDSREAPKAAIFVQTGSKSWVRFDNLGVVRAPLSDKMVETDWISFGKPPILFINRHDLYEQLVIHQKDQEAFGSPIMLGKAVQQFIDKDSKGIVVDGKIVTDKNVKLTVKVDAKEKVLRASEAFALGSGGQKVVKKNKRESSIGSVLLARARSHKDKAFSSAEETVLEARLSQDLQRRGIPHILPLSVVPRQNRKKVGIEMPLAAGTLERFVPGSRMDPHSGDYKERIHLARLAAETLSALHNKKMSYNDLKVENCLYMNSSNPEEQIFFSDLGSVRSVGEKGFALTFISPNALTKALDSPEGDFEASIELDLWAFGVFLYELTEGVFPAGFRIAEIGTDSDIQHAPDRMREQAKQLCASLSDENNPAAPIIRKCLMSSEDPKLTMSLILKELRAIEAHG